jgi:hypothetical protein
VTFREEREPWDRNTKAKDKEGREGIKLPISGVNGQKALIKKPCRARFS